MQREDKALLPDNSDIRTTGSARKALLDVFKYLGYESLMDYFWGMDRYKTGDCEVKQRIKDAIARLDEVKKSGKGESCP